MVRIKNIFKNKLILAHLAIIVLFFFISFVANRFASGSFVGVGDFYQMLSPKIHWSRNLYLWLNQSGQGRFNTLFVTFPFYALLGLADYLGLSSSAIASLILFLVLYASFLSFYLSIRFVFPKLDSRLQIAGGLLYALNNFTITMFTYSWGFSHQFLIYIFLPPLIGIIFKIFSEHINLRNFALLALVLIASYMSFNNVAFFIAVVFLQFVILIVALLIGKFKLNREFWYKVIGVAAVYLASATIYFLLPLFLSMKEEISQISNTSVWGVGGLRERLISTSSTYLNSLFMAMDGTRYPFKISKIAGVLSVAYYGSLLGLVYLMIKRIKALAQEKKEELETTLVLLVVFVVLMILSVRAYGVFETLNLKFYQLAILNTFRSPDKIFVLIPFVFAALLLGLLSLIKIKRKLFYGLFFVLLVIPFPFYTGKIVKLLRDPGIEKDYQFVNTIPNEYYSAAKLINQDTRSTAVVSLPYSVVNSLGWSNYYKWHYVGADLLHLLFNKNYVSANDFDHPLKETDLSFREYEISGIEDQDKFLSLIENFGGQYIIFHKDIEQKWLDQSTLTQKTLSDLESSKKIIEVEDNDYFVLYKLADQFVKPIISASAGNLTFKKINPTEYKIELDNIPSDNSFELRFDQSYNSQWRLFPGTRFNCSQSHFYSDQAKECQFEQNSFFNKGDSSFFLKKSLADSSHRIEGTYANVWTLDKTLGNNAVRQNPDGTYNLSLTLFFKPQSYFYVGILINTILALASTIYLLLTFRRKVKE